MCRRRRVDRILRRRLGNHISEDQPETRVSITVRRRKGPKWGSGVSVDVVVRLLQGGREYRLRAANQPVARTII